MTTRRCQGKNHPADQDRFYDKRLHECPVCGEPKYAHNTWLAHANMNSHLNRQAQHAVETQ